MKEVFEAKDKLLSELCWSENPFVKDLRTSDKEAFTKYYCAFEAAAILQKLAFDAKACMLLGPKGVGKTSALCFIKYSLPEKEFETIFLKEPPQDLNDLAKEIGFFDERGIFSSLKKVFFGKKDVKRSDVIGFLKGKARKKKIVFFFDEAHLEKNSEMYMEFKYVLDDVPEARAVICALSAEGFPDSLMHLVGEKNVFHRNGFTAQEMTKIIEHRVNAVGGSGVKPFPEAFLKQVLTERNLLSPRYVFDELNNFLAGLALGETKWKGAVEYAGDPIIQAAITNSLEEKRITTSHADWWSLLSPSQKQILETLLTTNAGNGMTLNEIKKKTGLTENTAFNALYQLRGDDEAEKKRKPDVPFPLVTADLKLVGSKKRNVYFVDAKIRNLFTTH